MSEELFKTLYDIFKNNTYAKGNFQYVLGSAIFKNGEITMIEAKEVLQRANPERRVSFFTGHRVFEVLEKKAVLKEKDPANGLLIMPHYSELTKAQVTKLRALAKREGDKFEESSKE